MNAAKERPTMKGGRQFAASTIARVKPADAPRTHTKKTSGKARNDRILDSLADAISLIATAASAIEYAEDSPAKDDPAARSDKARCLALGLQQLCRVRIDIAVALREVQR